MTRRSKRKSATAKSSKKSQKESSQEEIDDSLLDDSAEQDYSEEAEGSDVVKESEEDSEINPPEEKTDIEMSQSDTTNITEHDTTASDKVTDEEAAAGETKSSLVENKDNMEAMDNVSSMQVSADNTTAAEETTVIEDSTANQTSNIPEKTDISPLPQSVEMGEECCKSDEKSIITENVSMEETESAKEENEVTPPLQETKNEDSNSDLSEMKKSPGPDAYEVLDEIDLTKSDEEESMDVADEGSEEPPPEYIVPDYDDPSLVELEIDSEQDGNSKIKESKDFLKYWRPVQDNPQEFTSWTYLLQFVEQDGKLPLIRRAYNSFFCRYPLCYGYWKKFSEVERKSGNLLRAQKILERGVRAIPLSIDLWVHVIDFYINHYNREDAGTDKVKTIFDRAITAAGEEFRSEKLWNKYIKWEKVNKNWIAVMDIYHRALKTQTQHYSILFNEFKAFVNKHSPTDLLSSEEFQELLLDTRKALAADALQKAEEKSEEKKDDDCEVVGDKEEDMDEAPPGVEDFEKPPSDEELKAIRLQIIKSQKNVYDKTEQLVTKIWAFEEGIKRPYFHVKQLERAQLKNWREYLDMEIAREDHHRIVLLFERCLIACALYEDFWLKYAKYMANFDVEKAGKIFERACKIHLPKKPNIHIQWSAHEELQGHFENACKILESLDDILPGMAMIKMRRVAIERRAGNVQVAEDLLKAYVASAAKDKEEIFYTRKLAWFLLKIADKKDEARKLLKELIPKYKSELKLYNDLVEMEFQCAKKGYPANTDEELLAMEAFDIALTSDKLTDDQKFNFSQRKLEYLEDFGCDVKRLQKVYDEHQKLVRNHKKRTQIDLTGDDTPAKKAKTESATISVVGTSQLSNGSRYTSTAPATVTNYSSPQTAYAAGDPSLYYQQQQQQQQQQSYWNYGKTGDTQQQYNYSQWSQYYSGQR